MPQDIKKTDDPFDIDPDDELQSVTDPWVIETLGFDPLELDDESDPRES